MNKEAGVKVTKAVNNGLIDLYWNISEYISTKSKKDGWGSGTVQNLSDFLKKNRAKFKRILVTEFMENETIL